VSAREARCGGSNCSLRGAGEGLSPLVLDDVDAGGETGALETAVRRHAMRTGTAGGLEDLLDVEGISRTQ